MGNLCLLTLLVSLVSQDWVQGRALNIQDSEEQNIRGHLYLLDSSTGHSQRLKRRHVASPQNVQLLRLNLSSINKVIDIDLQEGSVWSSSSDALLRHGEEAETFNPAVGRNCHFAGRVRLAVGYASFSFCSGVSGIIHTNNETYTIEHDADDTNGTATEDTDTDFPSLLVTISNSGGGQSTQTEDIDLDPVEALETDDEDVFADGDDDLKATDVPRVEATTPGSEHSSVSTTLKAGRGKATIEVGIYINANYINILKDRQITTASQIVDWVINRWNIIRQVYQDTGRIGAEVDIKIKRLEIWSKNPDYYGSSNESQSIKSHLHLFCEQLPEDGVDHKMMYTWETRKKIVGISHVGGVCHPKHKCSLVMPQRNGVQRELHELGHNLGLLHDPKIANCTWPYGFMGWEPTTEFKDCYRPLFLASLAKRSRDCLYSSSSLTAEVSVYSQDKLASVNQSLSSILDKW